MVHVRLFLLSSAFNQEYFPFTNSIVDTFVDPPLKYNTKYNFIPSEKDEMHLECGGSNPQSFSLFFFVFFGNAKIQTRNIQMQLSSTRHEQNCGSDIWWGGVEMVMTTAKRNPGIAIPRAKNWLCMTGKWSNAISIAVAFGNVNVFYFVTLYFGSW